MFPLNATQYSFVIYGNITQSIFNASTSGYSNHTVLSVAMQQEKDLSDTIVLCDTVPIAKNYGKDFAQVLMNYDCQGELHVVKTGNDEAFVSITVMHEEPIYATTTVITNGPTLHEWTFVMGVAIFFLSLLAWEKLRVFRFS